MEISGVSTQGGLLSGTCMIWFWYDMLNWWCEVEYDDDDDDNCNHGIIRPDKFRQQYQVDHRSYYMLLFMSHSSNILSYQSHPFDSFSRHILLTAFHDELFSHLFKSLSFNSLLYRTLLTAFQLLTDFHLKTHLYRQEPFLILTLSSPFPLSSTQALVNDRMKKLSIKTVLTLWC